MPITKDTFEAMTQGQAIDEASTAVGNADQLVALPDHFKLHDLEPYRVNRRRARGSMATYSCDDFAEYVQAHAEAGASVFVDAENMTAVAVLNLGEPTTPGHADNLAKLVGKKTAAYLALLAIVDKPLPQQRLAEFMEDWGDCVSCFIDDGEIPNKQGIAAVRSITIDAARKTNSNVGDLQADTSVFDSVAASSKHQLPSRISFECEPFVGLTERKFLLRLSVTTTDKPLLTVRIAQFEAELEAMADELGDRVRDAIGSTVPVFAGVYRASA